MTQRKTGARVRPAESVHTRTFDGELVILDLAKGEYYALDEIGARLWAGLDAGKALQEIAEEIAAEYEVEEVQALSDLEALRDDLVARGLLIEETKG